MVAHTRKRHEMPAWRAAQFVADGKGHKGETGASTHVDDSAQTQNVTPSSDFTQTHTVVPVDSQEGPVDRWLQIELYLAEINTATTGQLELSRPTPGKTVAATTTSNRHSSHNNSLAVPIRITTVVERGGNNLFFDG
ncbi:hypothetical protein Taro_036484 [Colocasia esculenta]|uniref:Uncharacterized protein n=1 Tax=Colocasia esculenta TaxID=4460 RepID=A0A843W8I9_COLES|nr:hypothetical protein [Colocasia esculenta]